MEFNEKLQQLRKQNDLTQEQLAGQLYVSRTAISKWESGRGYPNIDSLKSISELFSVSIDDLLSSEELITLAESENINNMNKVFSLVYGIVDLLGISFIFLPLFGQYDGNVIRAVTLYNCTDITVYTRSLFFGIPIIMFLLGIFELIIQHLEYSKWLGFSKNCSIFLHALGILFFAATLEPYATSLLFLFFMVKVILLTRKNMAK